MKGLKLALGLAALLAGFIAGAKAQAQDFYKGKTMTIVVGFSAGGGFDLNARLLARHIGRHIPGNPDAIVQNMPGAATIIRCPISTPPRPGTAPLITIFNSANIGDSPRRGPRGQGRLPQVQLDRQHQPSTSGLLSCGAPWGSRRWPRPKRMGRCISVAAASDRQTTWTRRFSKIFGVDIVQVSGYTGSTDETLAVQRGETDGLCGAWTSLPADWIAQRKSSRSYARGRSSRPTFRRAFPTHPTSRQACATSRLSASSRLRTRCHGPISRQPRSRRIARRFCAPLSTRP